MSDQSPPSNPEQRVYASRILTDNDITDRCLRKWIAVGRFPKPDGNLNGRNFWLMSTYKRWEAEVLAGRYSQQRGPFDRNPPSSAAA
jgi:hypothetical protein